MDSRLTEVPERREFLLWRLKYLIVSGGEYSWSPAQLLQEFTVRGDTRGLILTAKIASGSSEPAMAALQVSALTAALQLETEEGRRELLAVGAMELLTSVTGSDSELASLMTSLDWRDTNLLAEAIKICWNSWLLHETSNPTSDGNPFWSRMLSTLHDGAVTKDRIGELVEREGPTPGNRSRG